MDESLKEYSRVLGNLINLANDFEKGCFETMVNHCYVDVCFLHSRDYFFKRLSANSKISLDILVKKYWRNTNRLL